ncbi:MAG: VCBS repeat-containing protein [Planctomycetes bacterium]|nr:VCBS repeat-containing protein [Planctomycetota bacterium]
MNRIVCLSLSLLTLPLVGQSPFRTTRHAGLPTINVGDKFAAGDLDGDGDIDLFVANDNSPNQLLLNDGNGRFVDATAGRFVMQPGWNASHSVDLADIDGDGDLDILIGNDDNISNRVYTNDGFGFFTDVTATALPANAWFTENQVVADFDGDGDVDWFTVDGGACHFYANNGVGVFTDASATRLSGLPYLSGHRFDVTPFAVDIDGDGDLDAMIPLYTGAPYLIRNQGGVLSPNPTQLPATAAGAAHWFADYDGDGDPDIFANRGNFLFQNQGNGTFVDVTSQAFPSAPSNAIACVDVDNDGDLDLVTTSRIWLNNGNGTFTALVVATSLSYGFNCGVAAADFDGDGDIDLPGKPNFLRQVNAPTAPARGSNYSVEFHARPGSVVGACAALAVGQLPAGPFGVLRLDPATAAPLAVATITTGPLVLSWSLPNLPALAGLELHYQSLVVDALEGPVLGNLIRDVVQ